ncbi:MAG: HlyD family secretion protein [Blastocatellia bacterium]
MKRTLALSLAAIVFTTVSLFYFVFSSGGKTEQMISAEEKTKAQPILNAVAAPGIVEAASEEIEVGSEIAGKLKRVLVEEGETVIKGQTIAVIENGDFQTAVDTARAQIQTLKAAQETALARLLQTKADRARIANGSRIEERLEARAGYEQTLPNVENSRREFERSAKLHKTGDVSSEELERAETAYENAQKQANTMREKFNVVNADARRDDLARADAAIRFADSQVREFDAQIDEASARVREAEARLEKSIIRAPIAGVILRKRLKDGESVSPENQTGIVTIADTSALLVRVDLDETDVAKIVENQTAYVTADAYGDKRFSARVAKIGQILGRKNFRTERPTEKVDTKILEVLLELEPNQKLPLGLRVDAFISTDR